MLTRYVLFNNDEHEIERNAAKKKKKICNSFLVWKRTKRQPLRRKKNTRKQLQQKTKRKKNVETAKMKNESTAKTEKSSQLKSAMVKMNHKQLMNDDDNVALLFQQTTKQKNKNTQSPLIELNYCINLSKEADYLQVNGYCGLLRHKNGY